MPSSNVIDPTTTPGTPLTASQLLTHPAFPTNDWSTRIPPTSTGTIPINSTSTRPGGPFKIAYDIHGSGPTKIIWIMGLGAFRTAWKRQAKYFGHDGGRGEKYTNVVFDNRGIGDSGKPVCRYSSREMAGDVVEVLGGLGWVDGDVMGGFYGKGGQQREGTGKRDIVVVGVSMGGMIAQEVALLIPESIKGLFLVSTCPRLVRTIPFVENLRQRINMFVPRSVDVQLEDVAHKLFSTRFLESVDNENEDPKMNFPTVRDRFAAGEMAKRLDKERFTRMGFICQAIAAGWHHKTREQLLEMVEKVGGERICILHGTGDQMLVWRHFELFKEDIGEDKGVNYKVWDGAGHVLGWEHELEFNQYIEQSIERIKGLHDG